MFLIISDACVLIDLECGKLTHAMFQLPWQFAVPDILFDEELADQHRHLLQFGLINKIMDAQLIAEAYTLRSQHARVSVNDLLALILAKHENCPLLTGDKALKKVAEQFKLEVHGTIWLVRQLIQHKIITHKTARVAFQHMRDAGSRLPWDEAEKILE